MNSGNLREPHSGDLVTKRDDPNYAQVSGYVPKELALRFKVLCTSEEMSQSEALEEAIALWMQRKEDLKRNAQDTER
ncbi:MAG: hypothetical protein Kow00121_06230 [Elainellaceae cyanobacterium]